MIWWLPSIFALIALVTLVIWMIIVVVYGR